MTFSPDQIPPQIREIIKNSSEEEVTAIMMESLKMALENPDELAKAMPGIPASAIASMKFLPKTDAVLKPMANVMAKMLIKQVKHGQTPSQDEIMKELTAALGSSMGMGGFPGMGGMTPNSIPGSPNMAELQDMYAKMGGGDMGMFGGAPTSIPTYSGPALNSEVATKVERIIAAGKNRMAEQEFEEAESEFQSAVDILDKEQPEGDVIFTALQHLSIAQLEQAKYTEAEAILKRWLKLGEKIYSPEYALLAGAYLGLGRVRESQKKMNDAELLYNRALSIAEKSKDNDRESYVSTIDSVAYFYESRKRYSKSDPLFERSYSFRKKIFGEDSMEVAEHEVQYAVCLKERSKHEEALDWCRRALEKQKKISSDEDPEVIATEVVIVGILVAMGNYNVAEPQIKNVMKRLEDMGEEDALDDALEVYGKLLKATDREAEAKEIFERIGYDDSEADSDAETKSEESEAKSEESKTV